MRSAARAPAAIVIRRSGNLMEKQKPAGEGNPQAGRNHGGNEPDYSPFPHRLPTSDFRHIGNLAGIIVGRLAAQLSGVRP